MRARRFRLDRCWNCREVSTCLCPACLRVLVVSAALGALFSWMLS